MKFIMLYLIQSKAIRATTQELQKMPAYQGLQALLTAKI